MAHKTDFFYPVKRIGNEKNPKLIILLCNPGGNPIYYKRFPEYVMDKDGYYKDSGMSFNIYREYCLWWDNILKITDCANIKDTDVLALEYYPYHTYSSSNIPKKVNWDEYDLDAFEENRKLLQKHILMRIPVFVYYKANWFKEVNELEKYDRICVAKNSQGQSIKIKELKEWLNKSQKKI